MSALGHKRTYAVQKAMSALPPKATELATCTSRWRAEHFCSSVRLDVDLLRYGEGIVHIDAEIPDSALYLCVA
jgi:hypothetical protein